MVNAEPLVALRYEAEDPIESLDSILRSCRATEDLRRRARLSGGANLKELVQIDLLRKVAGDTLIRRVLGSRHRSAPVRSCIVAALGPHHRPKPAPVSDGNPRSPQAAPDVPMRQAILQSRASRRMAKCLRGFAQFGIEQRRKGSIPSVPNRNGEFGNASSFEVLDLVEQTCTSRFSSGSFRSNSLAMVTPSLQRIGDCDGSRKIRRRSRRRHQNVPGADDLCGRRAQRRRWRQCDRSKAWARP